MRIFGGVALLFFIICLSGSAAVNDISQRLFAAEDHRDANDAVFAEALENPAPALKVQALRALGRIQDPSSVDLIASHLEAVLPGVAAEAAFSLGLINSPEAAEALRAGLALQNSPTAEAQLLLALGRIGGAADIILLAPRLDNANPQLREAAARGIGFLLIANKDAKLGTDVVEKLLQLATTMHPAVATASAFALSRIQQPEPKLEALALLSIKQVKHLFAKTYLTRFVSKFISTTVRNTLLALQNNLGYQAKVEVLRGLAKQQPNAAVWDYLAKSLKNSTQQVVIQAMATCQTLSNPPAKIVTTITEMANSKASPWQRAEAIKVLAAIAPAEFAAAFVSAVVDPAIAVQQAAISQLHRRVQNDPSALALLIEKSGDSNVRIAGAALQSLGLMPTNLVTAEVFHAVRSALLRSDEALSFYAAEFAIKHQQQSMLPHLLRALDEADVESSMALLTAIGALGDETHAPIVKDFLGSPVKQVAAAAAEAYEKLTGESVAEQVPLNSTITATTPSVMEMRRGLSRRVVFVTTKGRFTLAMQAEAPMTVLKFVRLAQAGFYDGLSFHRVVPNFVVQGGDPRGDGFGGPGYMLREEISQLSHRRGTVGMATAGKDTGGSQFFVNHAPNLHLDGRYTVFAHVVQGMAVVDRLEQEDRILRTIVF